MARPVAPIFAALSFVVAFAAADAAENAPTALEIFARHEQAIGYSLGDGKSKPYQMETTTTWTSGGGKQTRSTIIKRAGVYFHNESTRNGRTSGFGFDGRVFWQRNYNGNVSIDTAQERAFDVTWAVIRSEAYDATVNPEVIRVTPGEYVVRIQPKDAVPADVYFDRQTYYVKRVDVDPLQDPNSIVYSDFKRFGSVVFATKWTQAGVQTAVDTVLWDAPLTVDDFSAPNQRDYATFPASGSTSLSFDDRIDAVRFDATINGVKGRFLLDSGAALVFINPSFATRAHLKPSDAEVNEGISETVRTRYAKVDDLAIGDMHLTAFEAQIGDKDFASDFDGLIGYDVLNQVVCAINFDKKTLTFSNPSTFKYSGTGGALIIGLDDGTPIIQAKINEKLPVYMGIDTGAGGSLLFTRIFLDRHPGIVEQAFHGYVTGSSIQQASLGTLQEIDVGPYQFFGLAALNVLSFGGFASNRQVQGLIGYQVVRRFNVVFDYRSYRMYLELNKYGKETHSRP